MGYEDSIFQFNRYFRSYFRYFLRYSTTIVYLLWSPCAIRNFLFFRMFRLAEGFTVNRKLLPKDTVDNNIINEHAYRHVKIGREEVVFCVWLCISDTKRDKRLLDADQCYVHTYCLRVASKNSEITDHAFWYGTILRRKDVWNQSGVGETKQTSKL